MEKSNLGKYEYHGNLSIVQGPAGMTSSQITVSDTRTAEELISTLGDDVPKTNDIAAGRDWELSQNSVQVEVAARGSDKLVIGSPEKPNDVGNEQTQAPGPARLDGDGEVLWGWELTETPDMYIKVKGMAGIKTYQAHVKIIKRSSSFLRKKIESSTSKMNGILCVSLESEVLEAPIFETCMKYMYTEQVEFENSGHCAAIMSMADMLKIPALKSEAVNAMTALLGFKT